MVLLPCTEVSPLLTPHMALVDSWAPIMVEWEGSMEPPLEDYMAEVMVRRLAPAFMADFPVVLAACMAAAYYQA